MPSGVNVDKLMADGILPNDSRVLSEHNNLIVVSQSERLVARIALQSAMLEREDPGNLIYSHKLSWALGPDAGVVAPIESEPLVHDGIVISTYPFMRAVTWDNISADQMSRTISTFNNAAIDNLELRSMDIEDYAQRRIDYVDENEDGQSAELDNVRGVLGVYQKSYPFHEIVAASPGLVHGDLHTGNIVTDTKGVPMLIDLDSAGIGPAQYDIASWHVRNARGDTAPTHAMVDVFRKQSQWNEESFRALMGWKIISSLTHTVRYEKKSNRRDTINQLFRIAVELGAAGNWKEVHVTA